MKNVSIKKGYDFSPGSNVVLHYGENKKEKLQGFGSFSFEIDQGEFFYVSQQWTSSLKLHYEEVKDGASYVVKPRFGKMLAFITLIVFAVCTMVFLFTRFRWSFIPLVPFALYGLTYVSILRTKYLVIKPVKE